ncbi:MAG: ABC-ATPase domain-containing protein [Gemmatimonadetes bacterium]|nr:ABC-ATPase domain-containing protein [Gemmatimonadota bacterium]
MEAALRDIDGAGYGAYKRIRGSWRGPDFTLHVDHVQGDPFATPSRLRLHLSPQAHGIPDEVWRPDGETPGPAPRRTGLCDFLLRTFGDACRGLPRVGGSGKSGLVLVSAETPVVVDRSGCEIGPGGLTLRFRAGLPARGRRCMGQAAAKMLTRNIPQALEAVRRGNLDQNRAMRWVETSEDHHFIQAELSGRGLVAFVRDGSVLPRRSGVSSAPLPHAVPFRSPPELSVTFNPPNSGAIVGMGVPRGVTVVTGGGFHGKTTLLEALQGGVWPRTPGDGREWVATVPDAVKVRSEDGRAVSGVDLTPFVDGLPLGQSTKSFSTPDASGSTSLAADILEAMEARASALLMDEDTCATNLMVRDARMQALVPRETVTPLIDRARELAEAGVSIILVTGGSGDYLDVADTVLVLEDFLPRLATAEAKTIAANTPTGRRTGLPHRPLRVPPAGRVPAATSFGARRRSGREKVRARGSDEITLGNQVLDLSAVEQLADPGQARAVAAMLRAMAGHCDGKRTLWDVTRRVYEQALRSGLVSVDDSPDLALPRPQEMLRAASRLRSLRVQPGSNRSP